MKKFTILFSFLLLIDLMSFGQNCSDITNFSVTTSASGTSGNTVYEFSFDIAATSGGAKGSLVTITCPGGSDFITNDCYANDKGASTSFTLDNGGGGYDVATCASTPVLTYQGKTTQACGGSNCGSLASLPVELIEFNVYSTEQTRLLTWSTASEINNQGFEIERSTDANTWNTIAWVVGFGNTQEIQHYSYLDTDAMTSSLYYRLKQIDFDGNVEYLEVIKLDQLMAGKLKAYPNPTSGSINLDKEYEKVRITNIQGITLDQIDIPTSSVDLSEYESGVYFIEVFSEFGKKESVRILKQ